MVPMELNITLDAALEKSAEFRQRYESDPTIHRLVDMAKKVEGMPRNASTHAAGVVITDQPVNYYVPLAKNGDSVVTQYTMTLLEELGLLKIDFLGLRNLSVIYDAVQQVRKTKPDFTIESISDNEPNVYVMMAEGAFGWSIPVRIRRDAQGDCAAAPTKSGRSNRRCFPVPAWPHAVDPTVY